MDVFEAISKRRSIRKFKSEPIPDRDLKKILEAGRLAPSGGNRQPWCFIVVREPEIKQRLSEVANNQKFIVDAGVVIVTLGIPGKEHLPLSAKRIPYMQDPIIAVEHMILASAALGYGTCWIGAFDEKQVKEILKIPEEFAVIALFPVGVPDENPTQRPRKRFEEIFFGESYRTPLKL